MNGLEAFFRIPKSYGNYKNNFSGTICQKIVPALQYHAPNLSMARNKTDYEIMPMLASQSHTIISLSFGVRFLPFKIKAPAKSTLNTTRFYDKIKPESFRFIEQLFIIDNCSSAYFNRKEPSPMELRVLQYFLAVTREQSISGAALSLHLSQPTLSRQLKELEEELGKQLFIRGSRRITLTEEGMILRKRAEEVMDLIQKAEQEISVSDSHIFGDVFIGAGETDGVRLLARAARQLQKDYPDIRYHISSGDTTDVLENLDKGLIDFGLVFGTADTSKYDYLTFPVKDSFGILMRKDSPLADRDFITPGDLIDKPLIFNRNITDGDPILRWLKKDLSEIHTAATYNLLFNASLMVAEGLGYAFALDKIINVTGDSGLLFKPLSPALHAEMNR